MRKFFNRFLLDLECYKKLSAIKEISCGTHFYISGLRFIHALKISLLLKKKFRLHRLYIIYVFIHLCFYGNRTCYVMRDKKQGEIIGAFWLYVNKWDILHHTIHLGGYFIVKKYCGRHLGTILAHRAIEDIRRNKYFNGISAKVNVDNRASLTLLENLGFTLSKNIPDDMKSNGVFLVLKF